MAWRKHREARTGNDRLQAFQVGVIILAIAVVSRVFYLQVVRAGHYKLLAEDQHQLSALLEPARGQILVHDAQAEGGTYPLAANRTLHLLYALPKQITNPSAVAAALKPFVTLDEETLLSRLSKSNDLYEPLQHGLTDAQMAAVKNLDITGLDFVDEQERYYPEKEIGSQLIGFVGFDQDKKVGRYGLEGAFETELAGQRGSIKAEKDAGGRIILSAAQAWEPALDGSDILLTIDRTIEFEACRRLSAAVKKHGADGGSLIILDPETGAIKAMCGAPDFDPNQYQTVTDAKRFLNASTQVTYEPGSVFKALTMAAAIDQGKVTPQSTYTDTGEVKIGSYTIKNSDLKAHGVKTMTQVLEESLNTGAIYAMQQIGPKKFDEYVNAFGFGVPTGVGISESKGNISSLEAGKDIYAMTGSFGQGITVTPLQLAVAYATLANGGKLMRPYVIDEIRQSDGTVVKTDPTITRQVIQEKTAATVAGMLVNVVRNGHGQKAGVPGYFIAGKTGTAQVPDPSRGGYLKDATIGTFAGFGPVEDPKFVMVVKIDRPRDVQFAESSAAPLFGELARFLLSYYHVSPVESLKP